MTLRSAAQATESGQDPTSDPTRCWARNAATARDQRTPRSVPPLTPPTVLTLFKLEIWTPRQRTRPLAQHVGHDRFEIEELRRIYRALGYSDREVVVGFTTDRKEEEL